MKEKKVTIREVAERANVSISSVSRYLASPKSIQPVAAFRIQEAIRELNYKPNAAAQSLRKGNSKVVGILVPRLHNFFDVICDLVSDYFFERGYLTTVCVTDGEGDKEQFYLKELQKLNVAGMIIAPSGHNTLFLRTLAEEFPNMVAIDRMEEIGCDIVLENHKENAKALVAHVLAARKPEKILFLHGWENSFSTRRCREGSLEAMKEADFNPEHAQWVCLQGNRDRTLAVVRSFLSSVQDKTKAAIFAFSTDLMEYTVMGMLQVDPGSLHQCSIAGFAVPGTTEKMGIDCPMIVKNPQAEGAQAAELLYRRMNGEGRSPRIYEIPVIRHFQLPD